jgi:NADH:ubiquinone oxidoreductase subunit 4 (subunit M)
MGLLGFLYLYSHKLLFTLLTICLYYIISRNCIHILTAIRQTDFKRIIAYTSIAHMNVSALNLQFQ